MNYPIANIFSKRALRLFVAILAVGFSGCATQTANKSPGGELATPSAKQTISKITTSQDSPNDVISAIKVVGKDAGGTPARVEILLKKDVRYDVTPDAQNLCLVFRKTDEAPAPVRAETQTLVSDAAQAPARFEQIEIMPQDNRVDLLIRADGPVNDYRTFSIETPPRMVFDLLKVKLPGNKEQHFTVKSPLVSQVRVEGYPDRTRIVLDTDQKYFSAFSAEVAEKGLMIHVVDPGKPVPASPGATAAAGKSALVNRIDFSSEADGRSAIIIGTSEAVQYKVAKAGEKKLDLSLFNTSIPGNRQRPLITTRFESAVDRIVPVQTREMSDRSLMSLISIELRENVPYFVEQKDNLLTLRFEKSTIPPQPLRLPQSRRRNPRFPRASGMNSSAALPTPKLKADLKPMICSGWKPRVPRPTWTSTPPKRSNATPAKRSRWIFMRPTSKMSFGFCER